MLKPDSIGYVNPVFSNCSVSGNDTISGQNYTGGFAGETIGAVMTGCSVNGTESVNGTDYSGGFIGRASNAVVAVHWIIRSVYVS